jgi:hypothetical protein
VVLNAATGTREREHSAKKLITGSMIPIKLYAVKVRLNQGDQKIRKKCQMLRKSSQNSCQVENCHFIYIKAQFERPTTFEVL